LLLFKLFAEMQKASISFVRSVCLSVCSHWTTNSAPTWQIFMKFGFWVFFLKMCSQNSSFIQIWREKRVLYMRTCEDFWSYLTQFFWKWEMFQTKLVDRMKTHILCSVTFSPQTCAVYEIMLKNIVEPDRPQMTI